jgi:putative chitinase
MSETLTLEILKKLWSNGDQHVPGLVEGIIATAPDVFQKYGITTSLTVALMFGQFSEECGAGLEMVENDNFTSTQLRSLWPSHFTGTMAVRYAHNPKMICDIAYGGRMGNAPPPSDDGYNYRGRGLSQVTGKEGYESLQKELTKQDCEIDILSDPDLINSPNYTLLCGVADFVLCGCLPFAEKGDVLNTTKRLNGGTIGLSAREQWTAKWRQALNV